MIKPAKLLFDASEYEYEAMGAYAHVFVDRSTMTCWKVFLADKPREHIESTFHAEVDAYKLAMEDRRAAELVPTLHRIGCEEGEIFSHVGQSLSSLYHLDLAYELDFINHQFYKVGSVNQEILAPSFEILRSAGIRYLEDASVSEKDGKPYKFIDFAIIDHELWHGSS